MNARRKRRRDLERWRKEMADDCSIAKGYGYFQRNYICIGCGKYLVGIDYAVEFDSGYLCFTCFDPDDDDWDYQ